MNTLICQYQICFNPIPHGVFWITHYWGGQILPAYKFIAFKVCFFNDAFLNQVNFFFNHCFFSIEKDEFLAKCWNEGFSMKSMESPFIISNMF